MDGVCILPRRRDDLATCPLFLQRADKGDSHYLCCLRKDGAVSFVTNYESAEKRDEMYLTCCCAGGWCEMRYCSAQIPVSPNNYQKVLHDLLRGTMYEGK